MLKFPTALLVGCLTILHWTNPAEAHCVRNYAFMVTQPGCIPCQHTREWFARNGVPLEEYDITDRRWYRWHIGELAESTVWQFAARRYGLIATPIIEIDGVIIRGYLLSAIQKETCTYGN